MATTVVPWVMVSASRTSGRESVGRTRLRSSANEGPGSSEAVTLGRVIRHRGYRPRGGAERGQLRRFRSSSTRTAGVERWPFANSTPLESGREYGRNRGCQYVYIRGVPDA